MNESFKNTTEEKIKIMQAYLNGEGIEARTDVNHKWKDAHKFDTFEPKWCWGPTEYRVKPKFEVGDYVNVVGGTGYCFRVNERYEDGRYLLSNGVDFKASELLLCSLAKPLFKKGDAIRIKKTGEITFIEELCQPIHLTPINEKYYRHFYFLKGYTSQIYSEDDLELYTKDYKIVPYSTTQEFFEAQEKHGYYIQFSDTVFNIPVSVIELDGKLFVDCTTPAYKHLSSHELRKYKWKDGTPCGKKVELQRIKK